MTARTLWMLAALLTTSAAVAGGTAHATTVTGVFVDARANVYGGDPGGGGPGVAAVSELLPASTGRVVTFSNVLGEVSCCAGGAGSFNGPDGGTSVGTNIGAFGGTSGIVAGGRVLFLVGVFRDADGPGATAPVSLNFTSAYANARFRPLIDQVFFIGDGLTGTGTGSVQSFLVPDAATRLELGFADALGFVGAPGYYDDNVGSLLLDYTVGIVPEPSTGVLVGAGLLSLGTAARRRRRRAFARRASKCSIMPSPGTLAAPSVEESRQLAYSGAIVMASRLAQRALATCAIWVLAGVANASPIPIYNTGVDSAGVVLPNGATPDSHYTLVSVPSGSTDTLVRTGESGFPIPPWLPENSLSRWIKPNNVGGCDTCSDSDSDPEGDYVYRTSFDLSGFDPATVVLTGRWATDDDAEIFINGTPTGIVIPFGFDAFEQWHPFTISSGFLDGINYLDFNVHNAAGGGNPSGLRVEISGRVIPEPATFVLLGAGLAVLSAIRRRTT